jgi:hypothetical protein
MRVKSTVPSRRGVRFVPSCISGSSVHRSPTWPPRCPAGPKASRLGLQAAPEQSRGVVSTDRRADAVEGGQDGGTPPADHDPEDGRVRRADAVIARLRCAKLGTRRGDSITGRHRHRYGNRRHRCPGDSAAEPHPRDGVSGGQRGRGDAIRRDRAARTAAGVFQPDRCATVRSNGRPNENATAVRCPSRLITGDNLSLRKRTRPMGSGSP